MVWMFGLTGEIFSTASWVMWYFHQEVRC